MRGAFRASIHLYWATCFISGFPWDIAKVNKCSLTLPMLLIMLSYIEVSKALTLTYKKRITCLGPYVKMDIDSINLECLIWCIIK